jgi:hypothetical protein
LETNLRITRIVALTLLALALLAPSVSAQVTITDITAPSSVYYRLPSPDAANTEKARVPLILFASTGNDGVNVKLPVLVNGQPFVTEVNNKTTPVTVTIAMPANSDRNFTVELALPGGRQVMYIPLMQPSQYTTYTIDIGGIERTVNVYAYPDISGFIYIANIIVVVFVIWFYRKVVKT